MSTEIQKYNGNQVAMGFETVQAMAKTVAKSKLFGAMNEEQALALMLVCQAEQMHPMKAVQRYHIIQGRPALRSDALLSDFVARGGKVEWHERSDKTASATFFSAGCPNGLKVTWTMEDANRAKVSDKDNWKNYPRQMLSARVVAEGVRAVDPGALQGMYVPEEMQDFDIPLQPKAELKKPQPEQAVDVEVSEPVKETTPEPESKPAVADNGTSIEAELPKPAVKSGTGKKGPWTKYGIQIDGTWYSTFDTDLHTIMEDHIGEVCRIEYTDDGGKYGRTITDILPAEPVEAVEDHGDAYEEELPM